MRALSLYLPRWSIERLKRLRRAERSGAARESRRCVLLVRTVANRQTLASACPRAVRAGVKPGMTLAHARALLPRRDGEPQVLEHDPPCDRQALARLARWATRFAPNAQADGDDGLLMDVTGCDRLYRGERNLLGQLLDALARLGFTATAVIAPTFGAAWALARHGPGGAASTGGGDGGIVERLDQVATALSPLPVTALRIDEETIEALHEVGVRFIGELLNVPRRQLPSRFSDDLMMRMDQALGRAIETINPVCVPRVVRVERPFDGPVKNLQAIQLATRELLELFSAQLLACESGAFSLRLTLHRYEADAVVLCVSVSRATRDARHLWQLLHPQLEKANLGHGVESIEVRALETARIPHRQRHHPQWTDDSAAREADEEERGRLIDVLTQRLGRDQVMRFQPAESHLPERAVRHVPMDREEAARSVTMTPRDRPTQLFERPEPIEVHALTPDGPVSRVMWNGRSLRVESCTGPERLTSEWWREPTDSRDYFAVRVHTGICLWLFRTTRTSRWFVHGWWA